MLWSQRYQICQVCTTRSLPLYFQRQYLSICPCSLRDMSNSVREWLMIQSSSSRRVMISTRPILSFKQYSWGSHSYIRKTQAPCNWRSLQTLARSLVQMHSSYRLRVRLSKELWTISSTTLSSLIHSRTCRSKQRTRNSDSSRLKGTSFKRKRKL